MDYFGSKTLKLPSAGGSAPDPLASGCWGFCFQASVEVTWLSMHMLSKTKHIFSSPKKS